MMGGTGPAISVCADPAENRVLLATAARLAVNLGLPLLTKPMKRGQQVLLVVTAQRLEPRIVGGEAALRGGRPISCDFARLDTTSDAGRSLRQPLARAVGVRKRTDPRPTIIDATAGYGEDAWLLASFGCPVLAVERHRVVAALLRDGILRMGAIQPQILRRLHTIHCDSLPLLRGMLGRQPRDQDLLLRAFLNPDVISLDPMFSGARKAAERKPLRVLRWLVGGDDDADQLFHVALSVARRRVGVKRPVKAEPLPGREPSTTHAGRSIRYDVYVRPSGGQAGKPQRKRSSGIGHR